MSNSGWRTLTLGDVSSEWVERQGSPSKPCPVYGVDRSVGLTPVPKYVSADLSRYKRLDPGMFAYNPMRLNIGSIGYCSSNHKAGLVSPDYVVFRCDAASLEPEYLKYYIESALWRDWTEGSGVGSVRVRIYYRELARMPITLPPVAEQRAIAHILGALDEKIEQNRRMNKTLEAMARALFKTVGGLRPRSGKGRRARHRPTEPYFRPVSCLIRGLGTGSDSEGLEDRKTRRIARIEARI
jgi:type I restriction enzyme, S subunit